MSNNFQEYRWGDLLEIVSDKIEMHDDVFYPLASIRRRNGGFFHRETLQGKKILTKTLTKAIPGTFVVSKMQVVHGDGAYLSNDFSKFYLSASYASLSPRAPARVDTRYIHYFAHLGKSYKAFLRASHGVHIEKMTFDIKDWLKSKVSIPPLQEQEKIVDVLTSVDEVIQKSQAQIDKLQDLRQATMNQLLTRGLNHTEFKDSPLGKIPMDWEVGHFDQFITLQRGFDLPVQSRHQGQYKIYGSNGIVGSHDEMRVNGVGVVTGRSGSIGEVWYVAEDFWALNTTLYVKNFHGNDEKFTYYFLDWFDLSRFGSGTGVPTLNRNDVHIVKIAFPKVGEQQAIASILASIDKNIEEKQKKLEQVKALKKSLMQDLLTGKKRVTV